MVAFVNLFDGSLVHCFVLMDPEERTLALAQPWRRLCRGGGIGVWSHEEVASEIACMGMTEAIWSQVDESSEIKYSRRLHWYWHKQKEKVGKFPPLKQDLLSLLVHEGSTLP
jgi:hypothetical protein